MSNGQSRMAAFCIVDPQSLQVFLADNFYLEDQHSFAIYNFSRYGNLHSKRTMLRFNVDEFVIINKGYNGVTFTFWHDVLGITLSAEVSVFGRRLFPVPLVSWSI